MNGAEFRVLLAVIRKTWGWHKKEDTLSLNQIAEMIGLSRRTVIRASGGLLEKRILDRVERINRPSTWRINKDYELWVVSKVAPIDKSGTSDRNDTRSSDKSGTLQKKEEKKTKRKKKAASSDADPRFQLLKDFFFQEYERIRGVKLDTDGSDYAALSQLLKRNKAALEDLKRAVTRFLESNDPFLAKQGHPLRYWAGNINPFLAGQKSKTSDMKVFN